MKSMLNFDNLYEDDPGGFGHAFAALAEKSDDLITFHDQAGRLIFASQQAWQRMKLPQPIYDGGNFINLIIQEDQSRFLQAIAHAVATNKTARLATWIKTEDDHKLFEGEPSAIPVEMSVTVVGGKDGDVRDNVQIAIITRDSRNVYGRFQKLNDLLHKANEVNASKTKFLANMSHELRTPLNAILGFSDVLQQELYGSLGDERYVDYSSLIHKGGQHLLAVVNDILDVSRIEAGSFDIQREYFNPRSVMDMCCDIMQHSVQHKSITLERHYDSELGDVYADKRALKQILLNLLSNAIKFSNEGSTVQLSAYLGERQFVLHVRDEGIGIAQENIAKLGKPFVQVDQSYQRRHEGAGLGLSVVKGLVSLHQGEFRIVSEFGKGTEVFVILPL